MKTITIRLPDYLIEELPEEESSIYKILKLGLKQLKIERAIERYKKGGVSLAKVAELAGISIREMIPIAYAPSVYAATYRRSLPFTPTSMPALLAK